tara:strand:+ start:83 stop:325 length:243 start_codon:yes stop_codon:yes gene_type:complete
MHIGDLISYNDERGIVVHVDDTHAVMRTTAFHSYVPVLNKSECVLVTSRYASDEECTVKVDLLERIDRYVRNVQDAPTGS